MVDHAPRIRAQQQAEQENAVMAELEKRSAPLHWALLVAVAALALAEIAGQSGAFVAHYNELSLANEKLVQCMNGSLTNVGGVLVSCNEHVSTLVAQLGPEVQP
jgi:hypothetical protein